jgi:protein-tyrosine-phosphatase/ubiquinone/menaquinone biosynthesis C-methylase UbiE
MPLVRPSSAQLPDSNETGSRSNPGGRVPVERILLRVPNVLFVGVGNAGRSQMARAFFADLGWPVRAAGTHPAARLEPNAVEVMREIGLDLGGATPRRVTLEDVEWADLVVRMNCGDGCPDVPGRTYLDWPIENTAGKGPDETRAIRDEIGRRVGGLVVDLRVEGSGYLRHGFADCYDSHRPRPPVALLELLTRYAEVERPTLVVDLGSGTGFSAEVWAESAEQVVGIEPNPAMREVAAARAPTNVSYAGTHAAETGLDSGAADVVTASQSFHWMAPGPTLVEVARILRPGGVFAVYDYEWPPAVHPNVDEAWERVMRAVDNHGRVRKAEHLERMRASGRFRYVREVLLHSEEQGGAERVVQSAWTLGPVAKRLESGEWTEDAIGLTRLREVAGHVLGDRTVPFVYSYRVRLGVR